MTRAADPDRVRRRRAVRLDLLKRRIGFASLVGFVTLFGLAAQHAAKGSPKREHGLTAARRAVRATSTTFFDQSSSDFSFGSQDGMPTSSVPQGASQPPPVAETSVS